MSVIVNKGNRVDTGENIYLPGESISGLSKKDENDLVDSGACRYPEAASESEPSDPPKDEQPEGMKHLGGGYYELSNGKKVRGKDKAIEAQLTLNAESGNPDADANGGADEEEAEEEEDADDKPITGLPE